MKLESILSQFKDSSDEKELQKEFKTLAPAFLYGGYIQVREDYQIYIRTVEFYFHSEKKDGIHDPIVYHRNGRVLESVPYFPLMTLHAHNSGFDITFESETGEYRASALIRSYEVKDMAGNYLKWDKNKDGVYKFIKSSDYCYNTQSTYLYFFLNGFDLGNNNDVKWIDSPRAQSLPLKEKPRQNVFKSESEWEYIITKERKERCNREWSFTREERV
jgi:hypothetical protein